MKDVAKLSKKNFIVDLFFMIKPKLATDRYKQCITETASQFENNEAIVFLDKFKVGKLNARL